MNKQLIIIGGGYSIQDGIKKDLWNRLEGRFTCGINYSYRYFNSTYLCCMNYADFYDINRYELRQLPLIITIKRPHPSVWEKNTILLKENHTLSGVLALYVATQLLDKNDEIFLLGYDYGALNTNKDAKGRSHTHFYQDKIEHNGIGRTLYYNGYKNHAQRDFESFTRDNIYNVSLKSNINSFNKISYDEFFNKLDKNVYAQEGLRTRIREKLAPNGGE